MAKTNKERKTRFTGRLPTICAVTPAVLAGEQLSTEIAITADGYQQVTGITRPTLTVDDQTGEIFFDVSYNGIQLRTFFENEPGLLRVTNPGTDDVFFVRVLTVGDPAAGTANQIVNVLDENMSPVEVYFLTNNLTKDINGNLLGNRITVVGTSLAQRTTMWYDSVDQTYSLIDVADSNNLISLTTSKINQSLSLSTTGETNNLLTLLFSGSDDGISGAITEFAAGGLIGAVVLLVIFAGAGIYTVAGPYDCSTAWARWWNNC